ncbi:MAG: hypothetical protein ACI4XM_00965 [Candidatus Coprovivens sp.]
MKKVFLIIILFMLFIFGSSVKALSVKKYTELEYELLNKYMSDVEIQYSSEFVIESILKGNVESYDSFVIANTYYQETEFYPKLVKSEIITDLNKLNLDTENEFSLLSGNLVEYTTDYKYIQLMTNSGSGQKRFYIYNSWLKMPKNKSFDVIALRWSNGFALTDYYGNQYTNGNSGNIAYPVGNSNYKIATNAIGLSQNLVDSATSIENELAVWGNCSSDGIVYGTYQHAQANITLATSKLYNFSSNGMGGVLSFYGNASGIYDNTPGLSLSYTC